MNITALGLLAPISDYLAATPTIDWQHPAVAAQARVLAESCATPEAVARACFTYVRDEIRHSGDHHLNPVTSKASEVLVQGHGYCYAKSHLLAALLRANGIPVGLCYQRLTVADDKPPYCLHGLNAVFLEQWGWYRCDARGNKPGVSAEFLPPVEQLAFPLIVQGEHDLSGIHAEPLPEVLQALAGNMTWDALMANLPDIAE